MKSFYNTYTASNDSTQSSSSFNQDNSAQQSTANASQGNQTQQPSSYNSQSNGMQQPPNDSLGINWTTITLLVTSVAILAVGILVSKKYKR